MPNVTPLLRSENRARRGYSLAELVVVLVILSIAGAVAVPRFAGAHSRYQADGAAHRVADAIRFAATEARVRGATVGFRASVAGDNLTAAVISPLTYLLLEDMTEPPFNADITRTRFADGNTRLEITPFGEFSTSFVLVVSSGSASSAVVVNRAAHTVEVTTVAEAETFVESVEFK